MRVPLAPSLLILLLSHSAQATIYDVDPVGTGDFPTIQTAVDAAVAGDIIQLTNGLFRGPGNTDVTVNKDVRIRSACLDPAGCIIDCQQTAARGFNAGSYAIIEAVTVKNALSAGVRLTGRSKLMSSTVSGCAGGVVCEGYSIVTGNLITGNSGSGVSAYDQTEVSSNVITHNWTDVTDIWTEGGGIASNYTVPDPTDHVIIINNYIAFNHAARGGGIAAHGVNDLVTIANNTITGNVSHLTGGGGIVMENILNSEVHDNIIWDNDSGTGSEIFLQSAALNISYCDLQGGRPAIDGDPTYPGTVNYGAGMRTGDPLLVGGVDGDYYLASTSPCVNTGSTTAASVCFTGPSGTTCMSSLTTATSQALDIGTVDMGAHFAPLDVAVVGIGYATIQAAIDSGVDLVIVPAGTYKENIDFHGLDVEVRSVDGPEVTTIEGSNPGRAVTFSSGECSGAILNGFTVSNAAGSTLSAVLCDGSSPQILDNIITGARGGILCIDGAPLIGGNQIIGNNGSGISLSGAECFAVVMENEIAENSRSDGNGGGILCDAARATLLDNEIHDNQAAYWGGGVALTACRPGSVIDGCTIVNNDAGTYGGGIYVSIAGAGAASIARCTVARNGAAVGGGIHAASCALTVDNTIVAFSPAGEAVSCGASGTVTLTCSDVYGNAGGDYVGCIAGQLALNDNLAEHPRFCDPQGGDYHLAATSSCTEDNNPACGRIGAWDVGCSSPAATVWTVCPDGSGDETKIQNAIDMAMDGDVIELCDGTYTGARNRDLDTRGLAIIIRSASGDASVCILEAQGSSGAPHRAFHFYSGESAGTVVQDITMTGGWGDNGGALLCEGGAAPTFNGCILSGNTSGIDGGAAFLRDPSSSAFDGCSFLDNVAGDDGGAITCRDGADLQLTGCVLAGNSAVDTGGALYVYQASPTLEHCTLYGNAAGNLASGIAPRLNSLVTVTYSIIAFGTDGEAVNCSGGTATLYCCDVFGNQGGDWVGCIATQVGTNGNLEEDPLFCNAPGGDLTVRGDSPCATSGCGTIGAFGVGCPAPPQIVVVPTSLELTVEEGDSACQPLALRNEGGAILDWGVIQVPVEGWVEPMGGSIPPGGEQQVQVCVDAAGLPPTVYSTELIIDTNDPDVPELQVPIVLTVVPASNLGEIYLSFEPDSRRAVLGGVEPLVMLSWYVLASVDFGDVGRPEANFVDGITGWEALLTLPPQMNVTSRTLSPPGAMDFAAGPDNWIVGLGTCVLASDTPFVIASYEGSLLSSAFNAPIQLAPAVPSSFDPVEPGWTSSDFTQRAFAPSWAYNGLVLNPVLVVKPDGTGDYPTIQEAIDAAGDGYIVELADGIFQGEFNRDLDYDGKAILIRSQSGDPEDCVIDCSASEADPHRGVQFVSSEGAGSVLRGVTIKNAYTSDHGAIMIDGASPTIDRCIVTNSHAAWGGAMSILGGAEPVVTDCAFVDNSAGQDGGAVFSADVSAPFMTGCVFSGNVAGNNGGGLRVLGAEAVVRGCTFYGNDAEAGAGLALGATAVVTIHDSILAFGKGGGAVHCEAGGMATLSCSDVYANEGGNWVGCLEAQSGSSGNLEVNPRFCDAAHGEFGLATGSPCLPANNVCGVQIGAHGEECDATSAPEAVESLPTRYALRGNHPNPFNPATTIEFDLPEVAHVQLTIYSVNGRDVVMLVDETMGAGTQRVLWNGQDRNGRPVASGIYFYRLQAGPYDEAKRMALLR